MERGPSREPKVTINPGYVVGQLIRALGAAENHADPAVRERAAETRRDRERREGTLSLAAEWNRVGRTKDRVLTP